MIISIKEVKKFIISVLIPLLVGFLSILISNILSQMDFETIYTNLAKPTFAPNGAIYSIVWPILYILMGISYYIVNESKVNSQKKTDAIFIYYLQLFLNFLWPVLFFGLSLRFVALIDLFLLVFIVIIMIYKFFVVNKKASILNIFYLVWNIFALVLNYFVWFLNK